MIFNDAIKLSIDRGYFSINAKSHAYVNAINLANQIGLNKTTQKLKREFGDNYKDYLTKKDLIRVKKAEKVISNFITTGITLKQTNILFHKTQKLGTSLI